MATPRQKCCKTCDGLEMCSPQANCCVECHMAYEEQHAGPYLPPDVLAALKWHHQVLRDAGMPADLLRRHSEWEEPIFAMYVPEEIRVQIELDHYSAGMGSMKSKIREAR